MHLYFAYGSNMARARLEQRVGTVEVLGRGWLDAHRHRFSKLGADGTGKGNIEAHAGASVWGVVYRLAPQQLERLGEHEPGYRAIELELLLVDAGREVVRAVSYQALRVVEMLQPTDAYVQHYLAGMREHGLPDAYCAAILGAAWPAAEKPQSG